MAVMSRFVSASVLFLFLLGCGSPVPLKVGTMPDIDSLPLIVARHKPIFAENRLAVDILRFSQLFELRDALINGRVDAIITDLVEAFFINEGKECGKIVRVVLKSSSDRAMFAIVAAPHQPATPHSLENARIALSREAMDRYVAYRLLCSAGVGRWTEIETRSTEEALETMQRGGAAAALLSEPFISTALRSGGQVILDDRNMPIGQTVIIFSQRMVEEKPALIRRFLRAFEQSVREINVRPWHYLPLAAEFVRLPLGVSSRMPIPRFPFPGNVPLRPDIESAGTWLLMKRIISRPIPYNQLVNSGFLLDPSQFRPAPCCGW
jgi:NitT/TauT family transport system substrate-binding protein